MQPARTHARTHGHLMPQAPATRLASTRHQRKAAPHRNFSNRGPRVKQPSRGRREARSSNPVKRTGQRSDSGERSLRPRRNVSGARASPRGRSSVYRSMTTSPRVVSSRTAMAPAAPPQPGAGVTGAARRVLRHASLSARRLPTSFFRRPRPRPSGPGQRLTGGRCAVLLGPAPGAVLLKILARPGRLARKAVARKDNCKGYWASVVPISRTRRTFE